ncbi:MAG: thioredoxin family protein [Geobacteraceae bacterium]|nr:thioredoxin family protein [Geobacteraceae bacterium]
MRIFLAVLILLSPFCLAHAELPSASALAINQALSSGKPTVIDLGARSCIPCKKMAPILESLSSEYRSKAGVLFIDVHEDQDAAKRFRVQMIPTQIFFDAKGREVSRHMGFMDKEALLKGLKSAGLK